MWLADWYATKSWPIISCPASRRALFVIAVVRRKSVPTIASNERRRVGSTSDRSGFGRTPATRYTATMPPTSEQLWDAIERIYNEDGTADKIPPVVVAK